MYYKKTLQNVFGTQLKFNNELRRVMPSFFLFVETIFIIDTNNKQYKGDIYMKLKERIKILLGKEHIVTKTEHERIVTEYERLLSVNQNTIATLYRTIENYEKRESKTSEELIQAHRENYRLTLLVPSEFPVEEIMKSCATAAWYNNPGSKRTFESLDGSIRLFFCGTVYEQAYEDFTADCNVYYQESGMQKKAPLYTIDSYSKEAYRKEL